MTMRIGDLGKHREKSKKQRQVEVGRALRTLSFLLLLVESQHLVPLLPSNINRIPKLLTTIIMRNSLLLVTTLALFLVGTASAGWFGRSTESAAATTFKKDALKTLESAKVVGKEVKAEAKAKAKEAEQKARKAAEEASEKAKKKSDKAVEEGKGLIEDIKTRFGRLFGVDKE